MVAEILFSKKLNCFWLIMHEWALLNTVSVLFAREAGHVEAPSAE